MFKITLKILSILLLVNFSLRGNMKTVSGEESKKYFYFDFEPYSYEIVKNQETLIEIKHKIQNFKPEEWKIKPTAPEAIISVYNEKNQEWVFAKQTWLKMPELETTLRLKITPLNKTTKLKLLIKNQTTNETYETPEKILVNSKAYENYYKKINAAIKSWRNNNFTNKVNTEVTVTKESTLSENQTLDLKNLKNKGSIIFLNLGAFLFAGIVGFMKKNDKMP